MSGKKRIVFLLAGIVLVALVGGFLWARARLKPMLRDRIVAALTNPKPPGDIITTGTFGPWQNEDPSLTPVSGVYTFQNADLSVFKGIAGTLASEGTYNGILERIGIDGWTDTPDFSVDVSGQPVHLKTRFHAIVDGTNGDTYLEPVIAEFGQSSVVARGGIYGRRGVKGKTVSLQVELANSRIEDLLRLAMRGTPIMTGAIAVRTKLELPPGDRDVVDKLSLHGVFDLKRAHFTRINVQEKIDELSQRARGNVGKDAEDERVVSNLRGSFVMQNSHIRFSGLNFNVPGATVALGGGYALHGGELDFKGTLRTEARVSQMTTGIKSFFLKIVDPIFAKNGAGAVIPFKVAGTQEQPKFGLDKGRVFSAK